MTLVCNQALLTVTEQGVSSLVCLAPKSCRTGRDLPYSVSEYLLVLATEQFSSPLNPCVLAGSVSVSGLSFP